MANTQLGTALRTARNQAGIETELEAANRAGVERGWLNAVELGRINKPDADKLRRIARLYGVHPNVFLRLAGWDVDEVTMPRRTPYDVALELAAMLKDWTPKDSQGGDPLAVMREMAMSSR